MQFAASIFESLLKSFKKHKFPAIFLQKSFVLQFSFVFLQKVL